MFLSMLLLPSLAIKSLQNWTIALYITSTTFVPDAGFGIVGLRYILATQPQLYWNTLISH